MNTLQSPGRTLWLVLLVFSGHVFATPLVTDIDQDNSFQGIEFGTKYKEIRGLTKVRQSKDGRYVVAVRKADKRTYHGVDIKGYWYRFFDGVFFCGIVQAKDKQSYEDLKTAAEKVYGPPFDLTADRVAYNRRGLSQPEWEGYRVRASMIASRRNTAWGLAVYNENYFVRVKVWADEKESSDPEYHWR